MKLTGYISNCRKVNNRSRHCEGEARSNPGVNHTYSGLLHCFAVRNDAAGSKYRSSLIPLWLNAWKLNILSFGDEEMHIDTTAPTTVVQNQNRNNNCKSIRLVRNAGSAALKVVETDREQPFVLFDLTGKALARGITGKGQTFPLESLQAGVYIAKTENKTVKLVKK